MTDAEVIDAILAGNSREYATLVDRYLGMVRGLCASLVRTTSARDDLVQETFVEGYLKLGALRRRERFGFWLASIARNKCKTWMRGEKRKSRAYEALSAEPPHRVDSPLGEAAREELYEYVRREIELLPAKTREAMMLCYVEGRSPAEVAVFLGVGEPALKKRLQYGRQRVNENLWRALGAPQERSEADARLRNLVLGAVPLSTLPIKSTTGIAALAVIGTKTICALLPAALVVLTVAEPKKLLSFVMPGKTATPVGADSQNHPEPAAMPLSPDSNDQQKKHESAAQSPDAVSGLRGRLVDEAGNPVERIMIRLTGQAARGGRVLAVSLADGSFRFKSADLANGKYTLNVDPQAFGNPQYIGPPPLEGVWEGVPAPELMIRMESRAAITGVVRDAEGRPVERAAIMCEYAGKDGAYGIAAADKNGRYIAYHDGGEIQLYASTEGGAESEPATFVLKRNESATHDFVLPPGTNVKFIFEDDRGPLTGNVSFGFTRQSGERRDAPAWRTITPKDGTIVFPYAVPGNYTFRIARRGYDVETLKDVAIQPGEKERVFRVTLKPAAERLAVQVLERDRTPVASASVTIFRFEEVEDGTKSNSMTFTEKTDRDGRCMVNRLSKGEYDVRASSKNHVEDVKQDITLPYPGVLTLQFTDPPAIGSAQNYSIHATVTDEMTGKCVNLANAFWFTIADDGAMSVQYTGGSFTLRPGKSTVVFVISGFTAAIQDLTIPVGQEDPTPELSITLARPGEIYGTLQTQDGTPLAGAELLVYPSLVMARGADRIQDLSYEALGRALARGAETGADGSFVLRFLPPGEYWIAEGSSAPQGPYVVQAGTRTGPVSKITRRRCWTGEVPQ